MNAYLYVHYNKDSKFNSESTLFITFKGSSSIDDFIHDLKSATFPDQLLSELNNSSNNRNLKKGDGQSSQQQQGNKSQTQQSNLQQQVNTNKTQQLDPQPLPQTKNITKGKAGNGFIKVLKPSIKDLCSKIEILKSHGFTRVIITGHSLGGALASLFGYYLKRYKPNLLSVPIHVITFGACCVFDAIGRNEFNDFLNISDPVFTLDRVTSNFDPVIVLPADLDHPGYTLLRTEIKAFTNTGRTNEIGEIRKMLGLTGYDGNDLLFSEDFVNLFTNAEVDFKKSGSFDQNLYREKFKIVFGSKAEEQYYILKKAMPDAKEAELKKLFNQIEKNS